MKRRPFAPCRRSRKGTASRRRTRACPWFPPETAAPRTRANRGCPAWSRLGRLHADATEQFRKRLADRWHGAPTTAESLERRHGTERPRRPLVDPILDHLAVIRVVFDCDFEDSNRPFLVPFAIGVE